MHFTNKRTFLNCSAGVRITWGADLVPIVDVKEKTSYLCLPYVLQVILSSMIKECEQKVENKTVQEPQG